MEKIRLLLYCTKSKPKLMKSCRGKYGIGKDFKYITDNAIVYNGKIVAECDFEVEKIKEAGDEFEIYCYTENLLESELLEKSCLTEGQLYGYLENETGYAIHIKNLHIFNEPKELKWNYHISYYDKQLQMQRERFLTKAPQNMCRVFDNEHDYDCVLISIRPEWLCKILNGEKTIEVRKKVVKEMMPNE